MNYLKVNIFDYLEKKKTIFMNNVKSFFGERIVDILLHYPNSINNKNLKSDFDIKDINKIITLDIKIIEHIENFNRKTPYRVIGQIKSTQRIDLLFFNSYKKFLIGKLVIDKTYRVTGKLQFFSNVFQLIHPNEILNYESLELFEEFEPIYNLSRTKINQKYFRKLVLRKLSDFNKFDFPPEWILDKFKQKKWKSFKDSINIIHKPSKETSEDQLLYLRQRLAFDELLSNLLIFNKLKYKSEKTNHFKINNFSISEKIIKNLDFDLTKDQKLTLKEIRNDIGGQEKMYRLLQGDVGSGKTIISLLSIADCISSGYQAVLMVPTELLAKQHYDYFCEYLNKFDIKISLLTGKTQNKDKIYDLINTNKIQLLIGTHSVYNKSISFSKLGLIVIDEQHKFGVQQRINLIQKSTNCHTLIMSATPIPRSLSFVMYGEINVSNIKTKPKGRKKIVTSLISKNQMNNLILGIKRKLIKNEQVFWILPNIGSDDSEDNGETVNSRFKYLKHIFGNLVIMIHGKMNRDEIVGNMQKFKEKKSMILISTTVIEVGINIPSATLMIVEEANKFGLAQLHQLRGRISRSYVPSNFVMIHNLDLTDVAKERLLILKKYNDGFTIAEKDLYLRGTGDLLGTNQSGLPKWKFFNPFLDLQMIEQAKINCEHLLRSEERHKETISFLIKLFYKDSILKNYLSA